MTTDEEDLAECARLARMRHHNATTSEQRREVAGALVAAILEDWDCGDLEWMTLGELIEHRLIRCKLGEMKDTEIVSAIAGGECSNWQTFPEHSDEWIEQLRAWYHDPNNRFLVDVNELRVKGIIGPDE